MHHQRSTNYTTLHSAYADTNDNIFPGAPHDLPNCITEEKKHNGDPAILFCQLQKTGDTCKFAEDSTLAPPDTFSGRIERTVDETTGTGELRISGQYRNPHGGPWHNVIQDGHPVDSKEPRCQDLSEWALPLKDSTNVCNTLTEATCAGHKSPNGPCMFGSLRANFETDGVYYALV